MTWLGWPGLAWPFCTAPPAEPARAAAMDHTGAMTQHDDPQAPAPRNTGCHRACGGAVGRRPRAGPAGHPGGHLRRVGPGRAGAPHRPDPSLGRCDRGRTPHRAPDTAAIDLGFPDGTPGSGRGPSGCARAPAAWWNCSPPPPGHSGLVVGAATSGGLLEPADGP